MDFLLLGNIMSLMLTTQISEDTSPYKEVVGIIYRNIGVGLRPKEARKYLTTRTHSCKTSSKDVLGLKAPFPVLKGMASYSLQTQVFIVVVVMTLHNYIWQKAHRDWLFEKYNNDELIVIVATMWMKRTTRSQDSCHLTWPVRWTRSETVSLVWCREH